MTAAAPPPPEDPPLPIRNYITVLGDGRFQCLCGNLPEYAGFHEVQIQGQQPAACRYLACASCLILVDCATADDALPGLIGTAGYLGVDWFEATGVGSEAG